MSFYGFSFGAWGTRSVYDPQPGGAHASSLLLETADYFLLETGDTLLLE